MVKVSLLLNPNAVHNPTSNPVCHSCACCQGLFPLRSHLWSQGCIVQAELILSSPYNWAYLQSLRLICQVSFFLKLYHPTQGCISWPKLMSFSWFSPSSNISSELCLGMFDHNWCCGCSSVWSLRITTALSKVPLHYLLLFTIKWG